MKLHEALNKNIKLGTKMNWREFSRYLTGLPLKDTFGALTPQEKSELGGAADIWILSAIDPDTLEVVNAKPDISMPVIIRAEDKEILDGTRRIMKATKPIAAWVGYEAA